MDSNKKHNICNTATFQIIDRLLRFSDFRWKARPGQMDISTKGFPHISYATNEHRWIFQRISLIYFENINFCSIQTTARYKLCGFDEFSLFFLFITVVRLKKFPVSPSVYTDLGDADEKFPMSLVQLPRGRNRTLSARRAPIIIIIITLL